jgi:hypothetical protein
MMGKPYSKDLPHSVIETIESVRTIASQHDGLGLGLDLLASFFSMPAAETAPGVAHQLTHLVRFCAPKMHNT